MKPHILHVIDQTGDGGAQVLLSQYASFLAEEFSFSIANLGKKGRFSCVYQSLEIPVFELGGSTGKWSPFPFFNLLRLIDECQPDIVHTHLFKANILGTIAAKIKRKKVIIHDHMGIYPGSLRYYSHYFPAAIKPGVFLAFKLCLDLSDAAIVLIPEMQRSYRDFYKYKDDKVIVLPNAIERKKLRATKDDRAKIPLRQELGIADNQKIITMVGRLEPEKDWTIFLKVAEKIENTCPQQTIFLAVGDGSQRVYLKEFVKSHEITNVRFLGYRMDVSEILHQSDLFLLTSKRESFGIAILEAMAEGCPVIATRSVGPETIITDGVDGLLADVGNIQELTDRAVFLLQNEDLRKKFGNKSKRMIENKYSLEIISKEMGRIYSRLLEYP